jgi:serine/threonine protein kinase
MFCKRYAGRGLSLFLVCVSFLFPIDAHAAHRQKRKQFHNLVPKNVGAHVWRGHWRRVLTNCIKDGNLRLLGHMSKIALKEKIPCSKLQELADLHESLPMQQAIKSAKRLKRISKGLQLSFADLFEMAFFIETSLKTEVEKHGPYLSRLRTGLAKTIEFDPQTGKAFIHLGISKKIGSGRKKVVTKSLLYHKNHPQVVAHCATETPMPEEIAALKEVQGLPGIMRMMAHTERVNEHGKKVYAILCKYYNGGTFAEKVKKSKKSLPLKQKMQLAVDILTGLASMHSKGYVHRDLNLRNCFFQVSKRGKHKKYRGIVADMGRALPIKKAVGVPAQGNPYYIAPEGVTFHRLKHEDYYHTDIFAMGCVLQQLFYRARGHWASKKLLRDCTLPPEARKNRFLWRLNSYRRGRFKHLLKKGSYRFKQSTKERIERMILKMVDPRPENRGTAEELREMMRFILADYKRAKKR